MLDAGSLVSLRRVSHVYNAGTSLARPALAEIELDIPPGVSVAVIGPTASGKTTLLEILAGLTVPSEGTVSRAAAPPYGAAAAMAFQRAEAQLFCATVRDDVGVGPACQGLDPVFVRRRVDAALETVGLEPDRFGDRSPFALSEGEQRRVALAGVLAVEPRLLVLDEVGAGLDGRARSLIMRRLGEWRRDDPGRSLVFSTHDVDEAAEADRVILLAGGRLLADAQPAAVVGDADLLGRAGLEPPLAARVALALGAECGCRCPVTPSSLSAWLLEHGSTTAGSEAGD